MGYYGNSASTAITTKRITERDKIKLLQHIIKNGGKITLDRDVDDPAWPTVFVMKRDRDNRIIYDDQGGGYKNATVAINPSIITDKEKTKILLS